MKNNIFETEESDLDLGIDLTNHKEETKSFHNEEKSGNYEGFDESRRGNWNASETKALMSCNQSYSKKSWSNPDKYLAFSDGAIKYIFKKAKERETGRTVKSNPTSSMRYGTKIEKLTFRRANEYLKPLGLYIKQVGHKKFDDIPTAGASSDGIICEIETDKIIASGEMKACVSWETLYERTFEATDEKSIDFWQTQQQTLAWNVDKTYYFVIAPPSCTKKYLDAEDIESMYDEWCSETEMEVEIIQKSELHTENLKKRMLIAEEVIAEYLSTKRNIKNIFYDIVDKKNGVIRNIDTIEIGENVSRETLTTEDVVSSINQDDSLELSGEKIQEIEELSDFEKAISNQAEKKEIEEIPDDLPF